MEKDANVNVNCAWKQVLYRTKSTPCLHSNQPELFFQETELHLTRNYNHAKNELKDLYFVSEQIPSSVMSVPRDSGGVGESGRGVELLEIARSLRQERLYVNYEKKQLQQINETVAAASRQLAHSAWVAQQQRHNLGEPGKRGLILMCRRSGSLISRDIIIKSVC